MHQLPTSNLLYELREFCGIDVVVLACQVEHIPESVAPGLSPAVRAAVSKAAEMVLDEVLCKAPAPETS
jgi:coenzyme F420 hydrogenase subunit delta